MRQAWDLVIIGGGASGLSAAVFAARRFRNARILLLEKQARVGKKLLATGNGTCNITHWEASPAHYHGADRSFTVPALAGFTPQDTMEFFDSVGVPCAVRDNGRVYPVCESAAAVLDCLRLELQRLGVEVRCDCAAQALRRAGEEFTVQMAAGTEAAKRVLCAAGGAAAPSLGGSSDGYALLTGLGYTRTPLFPSIVQLRTDTLYVRAVKGLRVDGTVTLQKDGRPLRSETGEILFTEYGLSGPAVMQVSRAAGDWERQKRGSMTAVLNLLPDMTRPQLTERLKQRRMRLGDRPLEDFLTGLFQRRMGQTLIRASGIGALSDRAGDCPESGMERLADTLQSWTFSVTGTQGLAGAQVTAGGIATEQFCPQTMESCKDKGLYVCGELLDVDGDCGGYNLQWAWASAFAAVQAMGKEQKA